MQYSEELGDIEGVEMFLVADSAEGFITKDFISVQDTDGTQFYFEFYPF